VQLRSKKRVTITGKGGYLAAAMVLTPWGPGDELRARKLRPGKGVPAAVVERSQRERLYGAMVTAVAEKGYAETSVADLLTISGVSRRTFYQLFDGKAACFVATVEELVEGTVRATARAYGAAGEWEGRARRSLREFLDGLAAQPAAARLCVVEAYAAGPAALRPLERAVDAIEEQAALASHGDPSRAQATREVTRAVLAGIHRVVYVHLSEGREAELPGCFEELWRWTSSYQPPPRPLRSRERRAPPSSAGGPPLEARMPSERILRGFAAAVGERGYAETTIAEIAARARISQATFYAHFADKEDAMAAAIELSARQIVAATVPALRRAGGAVEGVRVAVQCIFSFLASEPDFARLQAVEVYAAGPEAVELRNRTIAEVVEVTLALVVDKNRWPSSLAETATIGAISGIVYDRIRRAGPDGLPEAIPLATYVALAPFIGRQRASAVARNEDAGGES